MKLVLLFIVIGIMFGVQCGFTDEEISQKWNDYKIKFGKNYPNATEENIRKQLFTTTLINVEEHNKKFEHGEVSYTQEVNNFADFTKEEMRPYTHGVLVPRD